MTYRNRRVLVTGNTRFKGSWLSLWLQRLGAQLSDLALAPDTTPALCREVDLDHIVGSHLVDIRDPDSGYETVQRARPDILSHTAAPSLVRASYADPEATYAINVMGTAHMLDAAWRTGVTAVVVITSDKCHTPPPPIDGYREGAPMSGHDPYSAKAYTELRTASWLQSFGDAHGVPLVASALAGNVIGVGDWACDSKSARIHPPNTIHPWRHVVEPLSGYLIAGARLLNGDLSCARAWNLGPEITDMQALADCQHLEARWQQDDGVHPAEAAVLRLDSSDARAQLRWGLDRALDAVAHWHQRHATGEAAQTLMNEQLAAYGDPLEHAA